NDLAHLVSWSLLALATVTIVTGIVADAWDLNEFRLHSVTGYGMAIAALLHVAFSWKRLISYARFRGRQLAAWTRAHAGGTTARPVPRHPPRRRAHAATAEPSGGGRLLSRRGLLGAAAAGAAGFIAGRGLRRPPAIPYGSDVGVIYHEWSKPGVLDALGTVADWGGKPPLYKRYEGVPYIPLRRTTPATAMPVTEALQRRHSTRTYSREPLALDDLSALLRFTG